MVLSATARSGMIVRHLAGNASAATRTAASSSRAFSTTPAVSKEVQNVTVFGAGLMGAGIAQVLAHKGKYNVTLADVSDKAVANGQKIISKSLARIAKKTLADKTEEEQAKFVQDIVSSIKTTTDAGEAVASTDLVIEAIIENIEIKQKLFKFLDSKAPAEAIFASNTSSLSIADIAQSTQRLDRFGGFHAFNPVPQMKLVEVVRTKETSDATFNSLMEVAKRMGKTAVACVDAPGFIVNRLLVPYMLEAIRLVERGEATPQDVDTAMKLGAGYPMGPFELSDMVGLDTVNNISKGWRETRVQTGEISADVVKASTLLEQLVAEGRLGKKSEKGGFYDN
ncbi:unnamed protein product [Parajaminaea phylloscopi]